MDIYRIYNDNVGRNFSYVINSGTLAYAVDPYHAELIIDYLKKKELELTAIINTHDHYDHICGNETLLAHTDCLVMAHPEANIDGVTMQIDDDEILELEDDQDLLKIVQTPGHTMNHLSLFLFDVAGRMQAVICGDTLFSAGVGNCHNGGDAETLYHTLEKHFYSLPDEVLIYPGHEYWQNNLNFALTLENDNQKAREILAQLVDDPRQAPISTIAIERQVNPFFRLEKHRLAGESGIETFVRLRSLRDKW